MRFKRHLCSTIRSGSSGCGHAATSSHTRAPPCHASTLQNPQFSCPGFTAGWFYLWKCESVSRRSFIGGRRQQLKGLPLIFIHCPSICPTIEHQSKFYNTQSQINPNLTIPANKRIVQKPLSNLHPLSFSEHTVTPHGLQNSLRPERLKPSTQWVVVSKKWWTWFQFFERG